MMKFLKDKKELLTVLLIIAISAIPHAINMFGYPYYENDEGTYMSQAWSLLKFGRLAPYTYWYDHAPLGWFLIALWVKLTGGFFTFGISANSGRVLMLVVHIISSYLIYFITKKLTKSRVPGIIAILIFSLTPLGIYFQRRVLLDNMMTFWFLLSWAMLMKDKVRLSDAIIAGISLGIAVLTKENAVFFIPGLIYLLFLRFKPENRTFSIANFLFVSFSLISAYFLYAFLKKELFGVGFLGDQSPHVSLLETLKYQSSRGNNLPFWNKGSDFYISLDYWLMKDKFLIYFGVIATYFILLLSIKEKLLRVPAIFTLLFIYFLLRGALVINFYIVPLIPLLALNLGLVTYYIAETLSRKFSFLYFPIFALLTIAILYPIVKHDTSHWTLNQTRPQLEALEWIRNNVPEDSFIVMDVYAYVDMHDEKNPGKKVFQNSDWFWKFWYDPEIVNKFGSDWRNVDYLLVSHEMLRQMEFRMDKYDPLRMAYLNSEKKALFGPIGNTFLDLEKFKTTDGDWTAIYELKTPEEILLGSSWQFYKSNYIKSYGQVVDPAGERTTSEGQSYAMLRSVLIGDRETFDGVWNWTKDHLQHRDDKLLSWLWQKNENGEYVVADKNSASDADEDIALSLIFAYKKWGEPKYLFDAVPLINDIWQKEVYTVNGKYVLGFSADSKRDNGILTNPSYFSPASYRIFAKVDSTHPWEQLSSDSYYTLNSIGRISSTHLPSNWIYIDEKGVPGSAEKWIGSDSQIYGFDSFRTLFRVALDSQWFGTNESQNYLQELLPFFEDGWQNNKQFAAKYNLDGKAVADFSAISTNVGPIAVSYVKDLKFSSELYKKLIEDKFNKDGSYWGDSQNYYDQNWAWFITAFYYGHFPNLWNNTNSLAERS